MNTNIIVAMTATPFDIAMDMWDSRFELKVGMMSMTKREFTIEVHRLSEAEFILVIENVDWKDKHAILDRIYGRS